MKVIEVVVSSSRKVNLGNYESQDFFASFKAFPDSNENPEDVARSLFALAIGSVQHQVDARLPKEVVKRN